MNPTTEPTPLLSRLLWPLPLACFLAEHWERLPLVIARQEPTYWQALLGLKAGDALQEILASPARQTEGIWVLESGLDGHSTFFHQLHRRSPLIAACCFELAAEMSHPVEAELVVSPPDWQGLPYAEDCDLFILQIDGHKRWVVHPPTRALPLVGAVAPVRRSALGGKPVLEADLNAGDLLYAPRGYVLVPATQSHPSLHIGLRVCVRRWAELFEAALAVAAGQDARYGHPLPGRGVWSVAEGSTVDLPPLSAHLSAALRRLSALL